MTKYKGKKQAHFLANVKMLPLDRVVRRHTTNATTIKPAIAPRSMPLSMLLSGVSLTPRHFRLDPSPCSLTLYLSYNNSFCSFTLLNP